MERPFRLHFARDDAITAGFNVRGILRVVSSQGISWSGDDISGRRSVAEGRGNVVSWIKKEEEEDEEEKEEGKESTADSLNGHRDLLKLGGRRFTGSADKNARARLPDKNLDRALLMPSVRIVYTQMKGSAVYPRN